MIPLQIPLRIYVTTFCAELTACREASRLGRVRIGGMIRYVLVYICWGKRIQAASEAPNHSLCRWFGGNQLWTYRCRRSYCSQVCNFFSPSGLPFTLSSFFYIGSQQIYLQKVSCSLLEQSTHLRLLCFMHLFLRMQELTNLQKEERVSSIFLLMLYYYNCWCVVFLFLFVIPYQKNHHRAPIAKRNHRHHS